ncbi:MAG: hypothetical protein VXX31_17870, partial [Planctomycetota bacterium]|nr:hypothetical protein [Planctomycetota bacterium]MEC8864829.1 hypothetical protein [Planctomycetota bacterium]
GDSRLAYYRERKVPPQRILGLLAYSIGLQPDCRECSAEELIHLFRWDRLHRQVCWNFTSSHESWLLD